MATSSSQQAALAADAANSIAEFVALDQIRSLSDLHSALFPASSRGVGQHTATNSVSVGVVVLCASAVLSTAETVLSMVKELAKNLDTPAQSKQAVVLVLCGGIGHSTDLMHSAVQQHPQYRQIAEQIKGEPEARILQAIGERFFDLQIHDNNRRAADDIEQRKLTVLVEDTSTNCALNAIKTREVLEAHGINSPRSIVVSQDPTMCRRTIAAFQQVYADETNNPILFTGWPTFVPVVKAKKTISEVDSHDVLSHLEYSVSRIEGNSQDGLWRMERFMSLLIGEIPRMRDDVNGYGPKGKGSIVHVDIPSRVEEAWSVLCRLSGYSGR